MSHHRKQATKADDLPGDPEAALHFGAVSQNKRACRERLPLDKALSKADGKDIVKKSSARKGRYLLVFAAQLAPLSRGRLGTLAQLDTQNPVMYIDFPQGRLKFLGKLVFPRNKYMVMRAGHKDVLCEDVFDMLVIFPAAYWIGTKADNDSEGRLDMPEEIVHHYEAGQPSVFAHPSPMALTGQARSKSKSRSPIGSASKESEDSESDASVELSGAQMRPSQLLQRSSARKAVAKRPRYAEVSSSDADADGGSKDDVADDVALQDDDDVIPVIQPKEKGKPDANGRNAAKPKAAREKHILKSTAKRQRSGDGTAAGKTIPAVIALLSDDEDDEVVEPVVQSCAKASARGGAVAGHLAQNGKAKAEDSASASVPAGKQTTLQKAWDAIPEGNDHLTSQPTPFVQRPGRAAKTVAEKRLQACAEDNSHEEQASYEATADGNDDSDA